MFYFKDAAIIPSKIDTDQLSKVNEFKERFNSLGLYHTFETTEDFKNLFSLHLFDVVCSWVDKLSGKEKGLKLAPAIEIIESKEAVSPQFFRSGPLSVSEIILDSIENSDENAEEMGILDLVEKAGNSIDSSLSRIENIGEALTSLSAKMNEKTKQISNLVNLPQGEKNNLMKIISDEFSIDLFTYANTLESETNVLKTTFTDGIKKYHEAITITTSFKMEKPEDLSKALEVGIYAKNQLEILQKQQLSFLDSIKGLPPMTTKMNKAKKKAIEVQEHFNFQISYWIELFNSLIQVYHRGLEQLGAPQAKELAP
jgi:hypothetical protein